MTGDRTVPELRTLVGDLVTELAGLTLAPDDSFFAAGLTSAIVVALHQRLVAALGTDFDVAMLFKYHTVRGLAGYLADPAAHAGPDRPAVQLSTVDGGMADARRALRMRIQQRNR